MDLWEERAARNESLFREVNEQVIGIAEHAPNTEQVGFVCECSDAHCSERLSMPLRVYQQTRAHSRRFLVVPGHENAVDRAVKLADWHVIVEKDGPAGRFADHTDPRSWAWANASSSGRVRSISWSRRPRNS